MTRGRGLGDRATNQVTPRIAGNTNPERGIFGGKTSMIQVDVRYWGLPGKGECRGGQAHSLGPVPPSSSLLLSDPSNLEHPSSSGTSVSVLPPPRSPPGSLPGAPGPPSHLPSRCMFSRQANAQGWPMRGQAVPGQHGKPSAPLRAVVHTTKAD